MGSLTSSEAPPADVIVVDEINKRALGKLIISSVGNEGTADLSRMQNLRVTLQHSITFLDTQPDYVWKNAELEIIDKSGEMLKLYSGNGGNKFTQYYDGKDEVQFHCRKMASNWFSWLRPNPQSRL